MAHSVELDQPWRGRVKLVKMAARAVNECASGLPELDWSEIPLILCLAERIRPGRIEGGDDQIFAELQRELGKDFAAESLLLPHGRAAPGAALLHARRLLHGGGAQFVMIAATDSLITWPTLSCYLRAQRILTPYNSNGFVPGEGAAAMLLGPEPGGPRLICTGMGFATEPAKINSDEPLRGEGLAQAIKAALADAELEMQDLDFRITDMAGEQYYFKEAALALARVLRVRKEKLEIWHPAECIGEAGAVSAMAPFIVANVACRKSYAPGTRVLCHTAADSGERAAITLQFSAR